MSRITFARGRFAAALSILLIASACNEGIESPVGPDLSATTVVGQLERVHSEPGAAAVSGVTVHGPAGGRAVTDEFGHFRVDVPRGEPIQLRFVRSDIDATLDLGTAQMPWMQIEVEVVADGVQVLSRADTPEAEFEGLVSAFSTEGDAGARTAVLEVTDSAGADRVVVSETDVAFDPEGDVVSFDALIAALDAGVMPVRVEGDGIREDDGSIVATELKGETDDDEGDAGADDDTDEDDADEDDAEEDEADEDDTDDGTASNDDRPEFDGSAMLVATEGDAPARIATVLVTDSTGSMSVEIVEGVTLFDNEGDLLGFADFLAALEADVRPVRIEGVAKLRDDGVLVAIELKAETDEDLPADEDDEVDEAVSFDGAATLIADEAVTQPMALVLEVADTSEVRLVRVVEGETLFDNEGDLLSFADLRAAVLAGVLLVRVEGEGAADEAGVITAASIKAETDD